MNPFRQLFLAGSTAALLFCHAVQARVESHVNIHMPNNLHMDGQEGYQHRLNHFGYSVVEGGSHRYSGSLALQVIDAKVDLCHVGDAAPDKYRPPATDKFMLLAHRGNCTFVTKARHAQQAGAAGLVIADNACLCGTPGEGCPQNATNAPPCQEEMPPLADDGSGSDVSIPVVLLKKQDAAKIYTTLHTDNRAVILDIKWKPAAITEQDALHYGMWLDLHDNYTVRLTEQVRPIALALAQSQSESHAHFYPSYMLFNGTQAQCLGQSDEKEGFCYQTCSNNGRYCFPSHKIPGVYVVTEILHRLCLWKHHGQNPETHDDGTSWWDYVTYFDQHCRDHWYTADASKGAAALETCLKEAYKYAEIKEGPVNQCVEDSGSLTKDTPNVMLDEQLKSQRDYGLLVAPTVWTNGQGLHWSPPTAHSVLEHVCDGYHRASAGDDTHNGPQVCQTCNTFSSDSKEVVKCAKKFYTKHSKHKHNRSHHHGFKIFFWVVFWLGLIGVGGYFGYQKLLERQAGGRVGALSEGLRYAMLSDQGDNGGPETAAETSGIM